ncbi:hypothetical protein TSUD_42760 [Trifolium subterraneum]|uniref:Uncharacterized protein n=1 Tax=Trifolium subterraneum TaxID=3900 RepID=A0A2Z6M3E6_TRISU|nr:hypothetical protein TSUD_42760 [Trifolium subterraneum]
MSIKCSSFRCWALRISGETYAAQRLGVVGLAPWALLDSPIEEANGVEGLNSPLVSSTMLCRGDYTSLDINWILNLEHLSRVRESCHKFRATSIHPRMYPDRWILAPFGFHDGRIWTVGLSFIAAFGLRQRSRFRWRPKLRADPLAILLTSSDSYVSFQRSTLDSKLLFFRFNSFLQNKVRNGWLIPFSSHEVAVLKKTAVFKVDSRSLPAFRAFTISVFDCLAFEGIMADEGVQRKIPVENNINWVADDPRTTPSKFEFEETFPEDLWTDIEIPGHADWEVRIPGAKQRICTTFKNGGFPMYQIAFEHMGLRLPFTDLEMAIFNHLEVCPSQLHPNSLAFIRAFEIVAAHLQMAPTHKKYFEIFEESLRGFKDKWYVVRPITSAGWKTILVRGPKVDDEGRVQHRDDGEPIEVDCERFPFCWTKRHYAREAKSFTFKKGALSKEELADLKALDDFVEEFSPSLWEDREGNPICDEEGYQLSSKRFIHTKALLRCSTRVEAEDLLRM